MTVWITSDTHAYHKNITRGASDWSDTSGCRDFDTVEEMTATLVENINSRVLPGDTLYHLGDWSFGGKDKILKFREQIKCRDIRFIFGNHDERIEENYNNCQRLFTWTKYYHTFSPRKGVLIVLFHFPIGSWLEMHRGVLQIHGHCHGSYPQWGRQKDVGVDTNDMKPYKLDDVVEELMSKKIELIDHHGRKS